jgi:nucleotidyltransferase/DNA polymerase involved in DNA repair
MRLAILKVTGLPTRIGLGPTRTLSKVANALAKATEKVWGGVVDLHDVELRARMFERWPVGEVWGIGPALAARLHLSACEPPPTWQRCPRQWRATLAPSFWSAWCAS